MFLLPDGKAGPDGWERHGGSLRDHLFIPPCCKGLPLPSLHWGEGKRVQGRVCLRELPGAAHWGPWERRGAWGVLPPQACLHWFLLSRPGAVWF